MSRKWFAQHSIARDSLKLIFSGGLVQVVSLLLLMIVGRQYSQVQLGTLGLFLSWGGFLSIIAGGRYEHAIVVADGDRDASLLFRLSLLLNISSCLLLLLPAFILNMFIGHTSYRELHSYLLLIPLFVLLQSLYNSYSMYRLRLKSYTRLSLAQATLGLGNSFGKVFFGWLSPSVWGLLAASLGSLLLGLLSLRSRGKGVDLSLRDKWADLKCVARKFCKFPRYGIIQGGIDTLLGSLLLMLMPLSFSFTEVGIVTMAVMLARRPLQIVGDNLSRVYFQHLSSEVSQGSSIKDRVKELLGRWFVVALPSAFLLSLILEPMVVWLVGDKWALSAYVICWMLPMLIFNFPASVLNVLPDIFGRQRLNMYAQLLMLCFELLVLLVGLSFFDFHSFVPFYFLCMAVEQLLYLLVLLRLVYRYEALL
ncbi:Uncharacterised protein [Porphyromonas crevioricanis]|uniref:Polysaccharide biosynthesis protein n=1 Tax=Porphyromonas crevioricanis TaxID=393921 RepID=A0A2X4SJ61_9PORP|nr:oligosaccharide flippase family protein [Porphyromonas crevioricanis]GAD07194.1 hypothetical protein PORCAN_813 [Porphyromonas crevioricanis JCM 13913]SQH73962.1 Uncharacterised protein [Porphyromonas crevioricanis]